MQCRQEIWLKWRTYFTNFQNFRVYISQVLSLHPRDVWDNALSCILVTRHGILSFFIYTQVHKLLWFWSDPWLKWIIKPPIENAPGDLLSSSIRSIGIMRLEEWRLQFNNSILPCLSEQPTLAGASKFDQNLKDRANFSQSSHTVSMTMDSNFIKQSNKYP
jgi:hypothetical protein